MVFAITGRWKQPLLLHILSQGFQRIRSYGLLANRHRSKSLETCRRLLEVPLPSDGVVPSDREDAKEVDPWRPRCKVCEEGLLIAIETLAAVPEAQAGPGTRAAP